MQLKLQRSVTEIRKSRSRRPRVSASMPVGVTDGASCGRGTTPLRPELRASVRGITLAIGTIFADQLIMLTERMQDRTARVYDQHIDRCMFHPKLRRHPAVSGLH